MHRLHEPLRPIIFALVPNFTYLRASDFHFTFISFIQSFKQDPNPNININIIIITSTSKIHHAIPALVHFVRCSSDRLSGRLSPDLNHSNREVLLISLSNMDPLTAIVLQTDAMVLSLSTALASARGDNSLDANVASIVTPPSPVPAQAMTVMEKLSKDSLSVLRETSLDVAAIISS